MSPNINGSSHTNGSSKPDPKTQALTFIDLMCNKRDYEKAATYLSPDMEQYHDDREPIRGSETFLAGFKKMATQIAPGFHIEILDAVAQGQKVWIFVRISGLPNGLVKEGIDMTTWSEDGKLLLSRDCQRVVEKAAGT